MRETDVPEWLALQDRLVTLTTFTGAHNAYVVDAWLNIWCSAHSYDAALEGLARDLTRTALGTLRPSLQRGGRLDRSLPCTYMRSYAGVYVLLLRFSGEFEDRAVQSAVAAALPAIEALTVALPPPDGPGAGGAEGFGVA